MPQDKKSLKNKNGIDESKVDNLINALNDDGSSGDAEETTMQTKAGKIDRIPTWIKALLIKWWFVGAACFFFLWGLGTYISGTWDMILVFGLATGAVTDLLTNNLFKLLEKSNDEYRFYTMIYNRKLWALFANLLYSLIITILVVYTYNGMNTLIIRLNPDKYDVTSVPVAVGPILYSLFYLAYDMAFVMIKNLIKKIIKK